ncbi:MAG: sulfurtransferase [Gammaproteobacteria bacterium]|nr:sulfurtransferase [Gammaproteobacteria bacterium]
MTATPLILQPAELARQLDAEDIVIVDLSNAASFLRQHIPGAVNIDAAQVTASRPPVMGLLPPAENFGRLLSDAGISPQSHVVAYDSENGLKASRFLWTLDVIGHARFSLLDGGLQAWLNAQLPVESGPAPKVEASTYPVSYRPEHQTDMKYIRMHLGDPAVAILDARTPAEFAGTDKRAQRAGHIPGAVNVDWSQALAGGGDMRLRADDQLRALYAAAGITPDKEIILHCHTHQRSAHSYIVLKSLGYTRIKGYPGSWSEWGNSPDTPIE